MGRRSNGITEEKSENEIKKLKQSRNENIDKICKIVIRTKYPEYKGKVRGMTPILVRINVSKTVWRPRCRVSRNCRYIVRRPRTTTSRT